MIGEKVRLLIGKSGFTQKVVAEAVGMSEQNLKKHFKKDTITAVDLKNIADFLGLSMYDFFEGKENVASIDNKGNYIHKGHTVNQSMNAGETECMKDLVKAYKDIRELEAKVKKLENKIRELTK